MTALQEIPLTTITGDATSLADHAGKVLLVVNVASKCGLTPQYAGLEQVHERFAGRGFSVLGFPANNFLGQEPGTNDEIAEFCSVNYSVTFPLHGKISVAGDDKHPLYSALTAAAPRAAGDPDGFRATLKGHGLTVNDDPEILWNFEKFLIGKDGNVVARFAPTVAPDDPLVVEAIEAALG